MLHSKGNIINQLHVTICAWLLPIASCILILFITCLFFTGLQPLWDTHHASMIMLLLIIQMIIFLNSSYQNGETEPPFGKYTRIFIKIAVMTMPLYSMICMYSLNLRVIEYGWSVSRVWGALIIMIATLYSFGYAYASIEKKKDYGFLKWA